MKYRNRSSYVLKDLEKRARSLANLRRGKKPGTLPEIIEKAKKLQDLNITEFATDPDFLGLSFEKRLAQDVILRAYYGLPLDEEQLEIFKVLTKGKGKYSPGQVKNEAVLVLSTRSGKSFLVSVIVLYEATRDTWKRYVAKNEDVYICVVATRELQAKMIIQGVSISQIQNKLGHMY